MSWRQKCMNPVLNKEFRLRMRTPRSMVSLILYLTVIGLLALGFIYVTTQNIGGGLDPESSRMLFYFLSGAQLVLISFMTPGLTAGVISGEREKQTLNMLLTTQQSSATIILSKLFSSLSFMLLIMFATMPLYSIVFLFGGISPMQLVAVFAFYLFVALVLGSFGVLFSTLFKKTVIAIITTYGVALVMYAITGLAALFFMGIFQGQNAASGIIISLNPMAALISIFEPEISRSMFKGSNSLALWQIFVPVYFVLTAVAIGLSIRYLRPIMRKR